MHLRSWLFAALAGAALVGTGGGCGKKRERAPVTPVVKTLTISARDVDEEIAASGAIEAVDKAQLGFMVPGRIVAIEIDDGATVEAGRLLARLDDTDYRNEVAIADAKLAEVRARHERLTKLHELGSLTAADFEKITAGLAEAKSAAELAHRRLGYTRLNAPFAGRIVRHGASVGTVVAPGVPIFTLLAISPVWATLSVPEVDAPRIQPGQSALIALAAADDHAVPGTVETILPQADPVTRSFAVKVRLANADGALRPGNIVTARIAIGTRRRIVTVPPQWVQHYPDGALYVWVADAARGTVTRRIVTVGRTHDVEVEIASGLQPGDRIVQGGDTPLFDGMHVSVAPP